jgi:hypothetical protein
MAVLFSRPPLRKIMPISCTQLAGAGVIINKLTISCPYCKPFFAVAHITPILISADLQLIFSSENCLPDAERLCTRAAEDPGTKPSRHEFA